MLNILSTAPQLSISQKALRTLPEDGNVMPKHVGAKKYTNYSFSLLIMYGISYMFRHYIAIIRERSYCLLRDAQLRSSRYNIVDGCVVSTGVVCVYHATRHNTPIHNILSTAPQLSISQKALGTLPEDGNVMTKHVGATIHNNKLNK